MSATTTHRHWRVWVTVGFALQGLLGAVVLTNLPGVKERTGIDDSQVALVVLTVLLSAAAGSLLGGWIAPRRGSGYLLIPAFALQAAAMFFVAAMNLSFLWLFPFFAMWGFGVGLADAGNGMQGLVVQRIYGRPIMSMFYAFQTAAAIVGALLVAAFNGLEKPFGVSFGLAGAAAMFLTVVMRGRFAPDPEVELSEAERPPLPWRGIVVFGLVIAAVYIGDGVVGTWSSVYLEETLDAVRFVVPLGYAAYQACVLIARLIGDGLVLRIGRRSVVSTAVFVAAGGLVGAALAPSPWLAVLGFGIAGLGLGIVVPLSFAAAGDLAPKRIDEIVAQLNLFNYFGVVVGSVVAGFIADSIGQRYAIALPALLVLPILLAVNAYRTPKAEIPA